MHGHIESWGEYHDALQHIVQHLRSCLQATACWHHGGRSLTRLLGWAEQVSILAVPGLMRLPKYFQVQVCNCLLLSSCRTWPGLLAATALQNLAGATCKACR